MRNSPVSLGKIGAILFNPINTFKVLFFAYLAIAIVFHILFSVVCPIKYSLSKCTTRLTNRVVSIFSGSISVKVVNRFNLFAIATLFGYDLFRHGCFSIKQLCLEPVAGHTPAFGSFYYDKSYQYCKPKNKKYAKVT
jgi:hypothetical protein